MAERKTEGKDEPSSATNDGGQPLTSSEDPIEAAKVDHQETSHLPSIESLTGDSDFTPFLKKGVPTLLKRAALRKLWSTDPVLANLDGLNDYDDNFIKMGAGKIVKTAYTISQHFLAKEKPVTAENEENNQETEGEEKVTNHGSLDEPDNGRKEEDQQIPPDGEPS